MSARDRNAARYRLEDGLEFWHERWVLAGAEVLCSTCQACQFAREVHAPFVHQAGDFAQHPWRELAELLRGLPTVPA